MIHAHDQRHEQEALLPIGEHRMQTTGTYICNLIEKTWAAEVLTRHMLI